MIDIFDEIWHERERKCFVTGVDLSWAYGTYFYVNCFAHVLAKGKNKYPKYKRLKENIVLVTPSVHMLYDNGVFERIIEFEKNTGCSFRPLFELEKKLHERYVEEFEDRKPLRKITEKYLSQWK
jgi:hypothetical protein